MTHSTHLQRHTGFHCLRRVALAAAVLAGAGLPAQAQFYSLSGAVNTYPVDLIPGLDVNTALADFSGNTLSVGSGALGSFSALAGAWLELDQLSIANGGIGIGDGSFTATGAGTKVDIGGTLNRVEVGNWGTGSMLVSNGALVDATTNAGVCTAPGAWCNNFIGNGAGSTATLTVTGAGSELRMLRYLGIGHASVFTVVPDTFDFGTPGGTTTASVQVLDGGTLRSEFANVGEGPSGASPTGTERSNATVVIDGPDSRWIVTHNSIDNSAAGIVVANHANATGSVTVSGGGKLLIDGTAGIGPNDFLNIATNGGQGSLVVTGAGSSVDLVGINTVVQIGRSGAGAQGSFSVLAGATASTLYLNIGRDGAAGAMVIDGAGSQLSQLGVGTAIANTTNTGGAAFANIGRDGGTGQVTVSNGGRWLISDNGMDGRPGNGSPGLALGRGVGGRGTLAITGPGSVVEIVSSPLVGLAPGEADNFNAFVAIGFDNPATSSGELTISDGGKLILTGNAVSTVTHGRATTLNIGGRSGTAGNGSATVTGLGSEIAINGFDAVINVGRTAGASGTLNVLDQAKVSTISLAVGVEAPGTVNIDNAQIALRGSRTDSSAVGAGTTIGRGVGGIGVLTMTNGAVLSIEPTVLAGGMSIGGDQFLAGGSGSVSLNGGSSITIGDLVAGSRLYVGRNGNGTLSVGGASLVDAGDGQVIIAGEPGSTGLLTLSTGSVLNAGYVGVGSKPGGIDGGIGTLIVDASTVNTPTLEIGTLSFLRGDEGVINGNIINRGTIAPGHSPGRIIVNGGVQMEAGGQLVLDVAANGNGGYDVDHLVLTQGSTYDFSQTKVTFNFIGATDPSAFGASGQFDLDTFLQTRVGGVDSGLSQDFQSGTTWEGLFASAQFAATSTAYDVTGLSLVPNNTGTFDFTATPVPEPATWMLGLAGLVALSAWLRRQRVVPLALPV